MRKILFIFLFTLVFSLTSAAKEKLPRANVISMFMKDKYADVNGNYILNFFIGELSVFLDANNIEAVYKKSLSGVPNGWYMMLEFSGRTTLSSNGVYKYVYEDVNIFCIPADEYRSDEGYWIELGDFTVGTGRGDLVRYFKDHISR